MGNTLITRLDAELAGGRSSLVVGMTAYCIRAVVDWRSFRIANGITDLPAYSAVIQRDYHLVLDGYRQANRAIRCRLTLDGMHALSHPIGALCGTHHGLTNAVLMPFLQFNRNAIAGRVAAYLGLGSSFDVLFWTLALRRELEISHTLSGIDVAPDRFDELSRMAAADPSAAGNPVKFDAAAAMLVLAAAHNGI